MTGNGSGQLIQSGVVLLQELADGALPALGAGGDGQLLGGKHGTQRAADVTHTRVGVFCPLLLPSELLTLFIY